MVDDFDFVVVGEGERATLKLLNAINQGRKPKPIQFEIVEQDIDKLPFPDYELVDVGSYQRLVFGRPSIGIISSRGCPYNCKFCTGGINNIDRWIRYRSPCNFVDEVVQIQNRLGIDSFKIQDDIFTLNKARIREIATLLSSRNVFYRCNARVDRCLDREMLDLLYTSGCRHITFGVESGSPKVLQLMNKRHTVNDIQKAISLAKDAGLLVRTNLMVGFPGETWDTVQETIDLLKNADLMNMLSVLLSLSLALILITTRNGMIWNCSRPTCRVIFFCGVEEDRVIRLEQVTLIHPLSRKCVI